MVTNEIKAREIIIRILTKRKWNCFLIWLPFNSMGDKLRSQSWVSDLFIASTTPSIEKFQAYILAKVHNFLNFSTKSPFESFLLFIKCFKVDWL